MMFNFTHPYNGNVLLFTYAAIMHEDESIKMALQYLKKRITA